MTRDEIDRSLRRIGLAIDAGTPEAQGVVAALFTIVADHEMRLRVHEPCPSNRGGPHHFTEGPRPCSFVCKACGVAAPDEHRWGENGVCLNEYCGARRAEVGAMTQAKDVSDAEILAVVRATRGRHGVPGWATTWDVVEQLTAYPPKVVLAKLRSCVKRGVIGGHACSMTEPYCRGDFEIPGEP